MKPIIYIDRKTGRTAIEEVYGAKALNFVYGGSFIGNAARFFTSRLPLCSWLYGVWQKLPFTRKKIAPFIQRFNLDPQEFSDPVSAFDSFNSFFIRKLKPEFRPISSCPAVIPADARYYFYQNLADNEGFIIKGAQFDIDALLKDPLLADRYRRGSMVLARLCPTDCHRFYFPCDCVPQAPRLINGYLYSVNPFAVRQNLKVFAQNKRYLTILNDTPFGQVLYLEIGATNVGSVVQTFNPGIPYAKGTEKGYFSFGASALILLFEPGKIVFEPDLNSGHGPEIRCLLGQPMGTD